MPDNIVGSAWIEVLPRTTGFESALLGGMKGPMAKAEGMFSGFGKKAALAVGGITLAGAGVGLELSKMAGNFAQQMTLIRTQAGDTEDNIAALSKQVLALAGQVGQAPDVLAQGLYHLASAGFRGAEAMDMLTMGAKLADVGQSDFQTTMQAVIFTMRSGLKDIHNASDAVAMLNAVVGTGDMRMQDLTQALASGILPVAAQFGVSMQSVGAALAFMTDRGVPANEATTRLRMSLALLAAPTKVASKLLTDAGVGSQEASYRVNAMTKALHDSGVSTSQLADDLKKPDGIMVALQDLKKHMDAAGVSASMQEATLSRAFGGGKSGGTIMMLYGQLDLLAQKYGQVGKNSKDFTNAWTIQSQTYTQRTADAKAAAEALGITWGNVLLPAATGVMTFLGDVAQNLGGVATGTALADKPAAAFAGTLRDMGGFASNVFDKLKPIGGWMMDHKQIIEDIGIGLAAWWAVDKIAGWTTAAAGAFSTVFGKLPGVNIGGKAAAVNDVVGQRVFVTNWAMMAGAGGAVAGAEGALAGGAAAGAGVVGAGLLASILAIVVAPAVAATLGVLGIKALTDKGSHPAPGTKPPPFTGRGTGVSVFPSAKDAEGSFADVAADLKETAKQTHKVALGSVNWSANFLVQGNVSGSALVKVADRMSGTAIDTGYIRVATGVLRGNVETLNKSTLWTDQTTLQSISDNVHGVGGDMSLIGNHVSDLEKYANEAALSWQGFMDAMAPYRHFKLGAIRQDGALPGTPGFQGGVTPPSHGPISGGSPAGAGGNPQISQTIHIHGADHATTLGLIDQANRSLVLALRAH